MLYFCMRVPENVMQKYREHKKKSNAQRTFNIVYGFLTSFFHKI